MLTRCSTHGLEEKLLGSNNQLQLPNLLAIQIKLCIKKAFSPNPSLATQTCMLTPPEPFQTIPGTVLYLANDKNNNNTPKTPPYTIDLTLCTDTHIRNPNLEHFIFLISQPVLQSKYIYHVSITQLSLLSSSIL